MRKWKNFSDFWQDFLNNLVKTALLIPCWKIVRKFVLKKILIPLSPKLCVGDFWTSARKFHQRCQNCILAVRRKSVRIDPEKRRYPCNSENWANFFLEISQTFSSSLSKLLHSSRSEKNIAENILFFEKTHFFRSFPTFYQNFQDLLPIFFIRVVKRAFSMSRRTLPGTLDFPFKKFYLTRFPESAGTTIGLSTIFFQWVVKIAVKVSRTHFRGKIFWKKVS